MLNGIKALGVVAVLVGSSGALAPAAMAQRGAPAAERMYNPATVTTVEGTVMAIDLTETSRRGGAGTHLTLKTPRETVSVHLGPASFINAQGLKLKVGDVIRVTGSRITYAGKPAIVASTVTKGNQTLRLRDQTGRPVWAGRRQRMR